MRKLPEEIAAACEAGGDTTVMVWADVDDDMAGPEELKKLFWSIAKESDVSEDQFRNVVFVFAKDRIENWIEFLNSGTTDESNEGPRVKHDREAVDAAKKLAEFCLKGAPIPRIPPSLQWSCKNWHLLRDRMS
jgi:hypothetical protein